MAQDTRNSKRFLDAYNAIDVAVRSQHDIKRSISYAEAIRRAARNNPLVAKYEDDLLDYGRLRNSIVHNETGDFVIAEPHDSVVENIEKIRKLVCTPPLAINTVCKKILSSISADISLKEVIEFIYKSGYSNIPIFKDDMLIGVANSSKICDILGKKIYEKRDICKYLNDTPIEEVCKEFRDSNYYAVADEKITLDKVLNMFTANKKLVCVVLTRTGTLIEEPIGIITITDIMDVNKILDDFDY